MTTKRGKMMFKVNTETGYAFTRVVVDGGELHREIKARNTGNEWVRIGTIDCGQLPKQSFLARILKGEK